ncbi:MAG: amidohydrolase [Deltaproteobacteria bacterium]|nr:amidohydrolase [Deltaproteobacteria bacterium]
MDRLTIVSCDCHAAARPEVYREYLEADLRTRYDAMIASPEAVARRAAQVIGPFAPTGDGEGEREPLSARWDPVRRLAELDRDGIAAEVLFPQPAGRNAPPFYNVFGHPFDPNDPAAAAAGCRAHNRWLADFVKSSPAPERHAGLALIGLVDDVPAVVREIAWAKQAGLRGVILRSQPLSGPGWHDPRFEPIWAVCEDLAMPIHTHGGEGLETGDLPGATSIFFTEVCWFAHRLFWHLLWSGVLERHPRLRLVFTEQFADWVPGMLKRLDMQYAGTVSAATRTSALPMSPSAYWARQCSVGASFMTREECEMRHAIGVPSILWGSDFPHEEGTWPATPEALHATFDGVPPAELRAMLGENAMAIYGFDPRSLAAIAARIGPTLASFARAC